MTSGRGPGAGGDAPLVAHVVEHRRQQVHLPPTPPPPDQESHGLLGVHSRSPLLTAALIRALLMTDLKTNHKIQPLLTAALVKALLMRVPCQCESYRAMKPQSVKTDT